MKYKFLSKVVITLAAPERYVSTRGEIMKIPIIIILVFLAVFSTSDCQSASVYSFEGVVSSLYFDGAGIIADEEFQVGDTVNARFYVDFQRDGYFLLNNDKIEVPENPQMTNNPYWYFYAKLLDGTLLPGKNGRFNNNLTEIAEYHTGYYNSGPMGNRGALQGGSGNSYLTVWKKSNTDAKVQNWVIGESLKGTIVGFGDQDWSIMWADMRLVEIQPIPLPSTFILLLPGFVSILGLRKKYRCQRNE